MIPVGGYAEEVRSVREERLLQVQGFGSDERAVRGIFLWGAWRSREWGGSGRGFSESAEFQKVREIFRAASLQESARYFEKSFRERYLERES